jgi:hypothetical protein
MAPSSLWHPAALCAMAALSTSPGSATGAASLWDDDPIFGLRGDGAAEFPRFDAGFPPAVDLQGRLVGSFPTEILLF